MRKPEKDLSMLAWTSSSVNMCKHREFWSWEPHWGKVESWISCRLIKCTVLYRIQEHHPLGPNALVAVVETPPSVPSWCTGSYRLSWCPCIVLHQARMWEWHCCPSGVHTLSCHPKPKIQSQTHDLAKAVVEHGLWVISVGGVGLLISLYTSRISSSSAKMAQGHSLMKDWQFCLSTEAWPKSCRA